MNISVLAEVVHHCTASAIFVRLFRPLVQRFDRHYVLPAPTRTR